MIYIQDTCSREFKLFNDKETAKLWLLRTIAENYDLDDLASLVEDEFIIGTPTIITAEQLEEEM